jgi:hypothetical protein
MPPNPNFVHCEREQKLPGLFNGGLKEQPIRRLDSLMTSENVQRLMAFRI